MKAPIKIRTRGEFEAIKFTGGNFDAVADWMKANGHPDGRAMKLEDKQLGVAYSSSTRTSGHYVVQPGWWLVQQAPGEDGLAILTPEGFETTYVKV